MKVGDKIIEWSYNGFTKNKHFYEHTVTKITPTGRIKTDTGIELNEHLRPRGKYKRGYNTHFVPFNDEIEREIKLQKMKDTIRYKLDALNIHSLDESELEQFLELLHRVEKIPLWD